MSATNQPSAILISTGNAQAVTGQSWRWCREFALNNGVEIRRAGRKPFVRASELLEAIDRASSDTREESVIAEENILRALGKRRRRSA